MSCSVRVRLRGLIEGLPGSSEGTLLGLGLGCKRIWGLGGEAVRLETILKQALAWIKFCKHKFKISV